MKLRTTYGDGWAIVTGPTSGIGLSFSTELSRLGYNVCLIGRNNEKLTKLKSNLENEYNNKTVIIEHDFNDSQPEKLELLMQKINKLDDISIVVNNVGAQFEFSRKFEDIPIKSIIDSVNTNILSQLVIYKSVLKKLKYQNHKSLVIDVCSIVSDNNTGATLILYKATKSFNLRLSDLIKLQIETENYIRNSKVYNIDVAAFKPAKVKTNFGNNTGEKEITADSSVLCCLYDIANGYLETSGAIQHKLINIGLKLIPFNVFNYFYGNNRYKTDIVEYDNILEEEKLISKDN